MVTKVRTITRRRSLQYTAYNHTNTATVSRFPMYWDDVRTSQGLKNWKTIIANNGNATTPFTGELGTFESEVGSANLAHSHDFAPGVVYNDSVAGDLTMSILTPRGPSDLKVSGVSQYSEQAADNEARSNLYKKISDQHTKFQGGVAVGEFLETLRMIASPAKALREGISAYVTNVRRHFASKKWKVYYNSSLPWRNSAADKFLAKSWLEYSFGWQPLVHDIQDAVEAFHAFTHPHDQPTRLSASGKSSEEVKTYTGTGSGLAASGSHISVFYNRREWVDVLVRYRCGHHLSRTASYQNGSMSSSRLRELFGFNAVSFIPTVWELIPYSFLVDYFVNVGDVLSAYVTDTSGVTWVCKTVRKQRTHQMRATGLNMKQIQADIGGNLGHVLGTSFSPSKFETTYTTVNRSAQFGIAKPSLQFTYPGLGSLRWLNIAALAGQRRI